MRSLGGTGDVSKDSVDKLYSKLGLRQHDGVKPFVTPASLYKGYVTSCLAISFGLLFM
jgi:hypothetical protein